jgi:hypothetical protein
LYSVTVIDGNGCQGYDEVNITWLETTDIRVSELTSPSTNCYSSLGQTVTVKLTNMGTKTFNIGDPIDVSYQVGTNTPVVETLTLVSNLANGQTVNYTFTQKAAINPGAVSMYLKTIILGNPGQPTTYPVIINANPVVDLGLDRTISVATVLDPGAGYTSYTWQDGSHNQTFTASATGLYSVTVIDSHTCQGYDEVNLTWQDTPDVRISQLITPSTYCYDSQGKTITVQLSNEGAKTFNNGDHIDVSYQVGTNTAVVETLNFTSTFTNGNTLNYTFTQKAIINAGTVTVYFKTIDSGIDGQTTSYPFTIYANPVVDLGLDRTISVPTVLDAGAGYTSYTWQDGSHSQTLTISATGLYSVTVIDSHTCQGYDEVNIISTVSVEIIPGSNAKVTLRPNPVSDELTISIETDKNEVFSIDFINPQGQIIKSLRSDKTLSFSDKINVNGYTPGIYFIKVSNNKGSAVFKVIVQR